MPDIRATTLATLFATTAFCAAGAAQAAVYIEARDGDLSNTSSDPTDVSALLGETVTRVEGSRPADGTDPRDVFLLTGLGTGVQTLFYEVFIDTSNGVGAAEFFYEEGVDGRPLATKDFQRVGDRFFGMVTTSAAFQGDLTVILLGEGAAFTSYSLELTTASPVPVPAAAALMPLGLAGLGAAAKRRRAKRR